MHKGEIQLLFKKNINSDTMNDLEQYFYKNEDRLIDKWSHYFDIYDQYFSKYRDKEVVILEIGVFQGGSLQMWKNYFGPKAKIYGIDINPTCKELEEENIEIFIGSQSDPAFLDKVKKQIPPIDILIDDGGHTMKQQIISFEQLFDHVKGTGLYLCEDTHTSYQIMYGGGHRRRGTFIEYSKNFIDYLNAHYSEQSSLVVSNFTWSVKAIHYYDSILIIEKEPREKPTRHTTGKATIANYTQEPSGFRMTKWKIKRALLKAINKVLRHFRMGSFIWK